MGENNIEALALTLFDVGAVKFGKFTLHSGKVSPIYFDLRVLVSFPAALRQVASAYTPLIKQLKFDILAAYPYAALPIGTAISVATDWPLIYPRKTAKQYGTAKLVEGVWQVGQTAVVIEDLITSGASILQAIAALKAAGLQVQDAVVLIDREQAGRETLAKDGYNLHAVIRITQLVDILEENGRITSKQHDEVIRMVDGG